MWSVLTWLMVNIHMKLECCHGSRLHSDVLTDAESAAAPASVHLWSEMVNITHLRVNVWNSLLKTYSCPIFTSRRPHDKTHFSLTFVFLLADLRTMKADQQQRSLISLPSDQRFVQNVHEQNTEHTRIQPMLTEDRHALDKETKLQKFLRSPDPASSRSRKSG